MRLTRKDAIATVLVFVGLTMALSVTQGWNWPLLGGVQAGIIALGIAGFAACLTGTPLDRSYLTNPYGLIFEVIAVGGLTVSIVGGLVLGTAQFLLALMLVTGMLWLWTMIRHAIEGTTPTPVRSAAERRPAIATKRALQ
jgi:hypothetical protein